MDVDEAYDLAFKYAKGQDGYPVDKEKSAYYLKIAADQGHLKAINNLAVALDRGDGVPKDRAAAAKYYKMAADKGHTVAQGNYGFMLLKGKGVEQDKEEALRYFEMAADSGYAKVLDPIVQLFDEGVFTSFDEQLKYYKLAADNGNESAMLSVVILLQDPESYDIKRNTPDLLKYSRMLAERENKGGMYMYAKTVLDFENDKNIGLDNEYYPSEEDGKFAVEACRKSAEMGHTDAMALYADCLLNGYYVDKDEEAAVKWVLKSFEDEDEASDEGYVLYGRMLFDGKVVEKDVKKAAEYFKKAAKYDKKGMRWYVKLMMDKDIEEVPLDQDEAVHYSRRGAEKGDGLCMYYYGVFLFDGNGVEQDREEAIEWIRKSRDKYTVEADYLLYRLIKSGLVQAVKKDLAYCPSDDEDEDFDQDELNREIMNDCLTSSALCDIKQSYYHFAFNREKGIGTNVDYETALEYYKKGADSGDSRCMVRYGLMHELGKGVDKDPETAMKYYKMAADLLDWYGCYNYATMLNDGLGIEKNQEEATKYFEMGSRGNVNDSMFRYGFALNGGIGVFKDQWEACVYYQQAAVQGDKNGIFFLGFMLYNGYGYKKNIKEGWRYIKMAAAKGNQQAQEYIDKYF